MNNLNKNIVWNGAICLQKIGFLHVDGIAFQNVNQGSITISDVLWFPHSIRIQKIYFIYILWYMYIFKCIETATNATETIAFGLRAPSNITLEK